MPKRAEPHRLWQALAASAPNQLVPAPDRGVSRTSDGHLTTPWDPKGSWGVIKSAADGAEDGISRCTGCLFADFANANHNLRFDLNAEPPTFTAVRIGDMAKVDGKLIGDAAS